MSSLRTSGTLGEGVGAAGQKCQEIAQWNRVLFDAFIQNARACHASGRLEGMLQWGSAAALFASRKGWFGQLSSRELEGELLRAAHALETPAQPRFTGTKHKPRWLHVLDEAYGTLGHTNLCRRWIELDAEVEHDVILIDQRLEEPRILAQAVTKSGGKWIVLDANKPLIQRAGELRAYAFQNADVVVLHTHPEDVIASVAFGVQDGPPVLFVNHADHCFWVGCAVADLVLDIRVSGHQWTRHARGVDRAVILPLPLENHAEAADESVSALRRKQTARNKLGIPEHATVFLTVGSAAKYAPINGLNFVEVAMTILRQDQQSLLLAVGPEDQGDWKAARQALGGRLRPCGRQPEATLFYQAADVYLEGFPAGSLTALLEAGEAGLACVRAPAVCSPPFSSDSPGLVDLPQPENAEAYVREALSLARDAGLRSDLGRRLQQAIRVHHCASGWLAQLHRVKERIPQGHAVYSGFKPTPVEPHKRDWLIEYLHANSPVLSHSAIAEDAFIETWKRFNLEPQVEAALWQQLNNASQAEAHLEGCVPGAMGSQSGATRVPQSPRPKGGAPVRFMAAFRDRAAFWSLNRRIRSRGLRERLVTRARLALVNGNQNLARKWTYSCLLRRISSLGDVAWLKMLLQTHLSPRMLNVLRK